MQLRRIRVRNIRSYVSADLPLGPGTTLLSGDVGSGKTSILYAIEMALFGFAEVDPTYLVRHQAGESEVVLSLADDGHSYEFGRRFRRRRRKGRDIFELESASFSVDGATTNYSVTEIRQRAISLLGFPDNPNPRAHSDLWRWAVYVPQERMREILGQEPDERLETVRKALGLEQYRTAADNAQLLAAELRRMAERADAEARGRDHLLEEQPTLLREVEEREAQARTATIELERGAGDLRASEALLAELELRRQSFERDRGEEDQLVDRARSDAEQLRRLDARAQEIGDESGQWRKRVADAAGLTQRRDRCAAELHAKDERLSVLRSEREARSRELAELAAAESKGDSAQEALEHARTESARAGREAELATAELARLTTEGPQKEPPAPTRRALPEIDGAIEASRAGLERSLASISRLEQISSENEELRRAGICPRCHQKVDVSEFAVHFQEVSTDLARERSLLSELRASVERLAEERKARERFDRSHQRWTDLEASRVNARERAARSTAQQEASAARLVELEAASRAAGNAVERLRGRADSARALLDELVRSERERVEIERQLSELAAELDGLGSAEAALERLASDERRLAQERTAMVEQAEDRRRQLATVRARLAEMPRLDAELSLARERREAARRSTALSERALERAHTLVESARSRLTDIGRLLSERQERLDAATRHRELAQWFGQAFREAVLSLEHRLLARAQSEFEREFSRFFTILVEDPGLIARCDAAFSPAVEIDGEWTPAEALSGGERTALALAFRLALGQVVRGAGRLRLETLILDEPTDGFSPEQVVRMGELLEGLGLPQVLLVSHETQLSAIADRVVRVQKEGGRSQLVADETGGGAPSSDVPVPLATRRRTRMPRLDAPGKSP